MKKKAYYTLGILLFLLLIPMKIHAFEHGYERKTDDIYATVRHDLAVYNDKGNDFALYLGSYKGIKVLSRGESWFEIEYNTKKTGTQTGWITKDDFYSSCLIYDGREKQRVADGNYQMRYCGVDNFDITKISLAQNISMPELFHCTFSYVGKGLYTIVNTDTGEFMQPDPMFLMDASDFWGKEETAGKFYVKRKNNYFSIQDSITRRYLGKNQDNIISFVFDNSACWRLRRYNKATQKNSMRVFAQFDAEWAGHYYGPGENDNPTTNVFCTSACGIFSTMNAIYALTGMYADPYAMADYAVEKNYRILDNGTDSGIFKAVAKQFGEKYGFNYDGEGGSIDQLKEKLKIGDVAIAHVPGHYVSIVSYNEKTKKFLLLDSHYLPKRATNAYGDWVSLSDLESGNLMGYMFYYYRAIRPTK